VLFEQNDVYLDDGVKTPENNKCPLGPAVTGATTKKGTPFNGVCLFLYGGATGRVFETALSPFCSNNNQKLCA
jgi:hypothetical protein